jgi:hypothetical protein
MLQPNDLPLVCLPTDLSDEAAAKLLEFLHELTDALERHYRPRPERHDHPAHIDQPNLDTTNINPPF